jgi:hypothetical protein
MYKEGKVYIRHYRLHRYIAEGAKLTAQQIEQYSESAIQLTKSNIGQVGGYTTATITLGNLTLTAKAVCSQKDTFCKRTGRELAIQRLQALLTKLEGQK